MCSYLYVYVYVYPTLMGEEGYAHGGGRGWGQAAPSCDQRPADGRGLRVGPGSAAVAWGGRGGGCRGGQAHKRSRPQWPLLLLLLPPSPRSPLPAWLLAGPTLLTLPSLNRPSSRGLRVPHCHCHCQRVRIFCR